MLISHEQLYVLPQQPGCFQPKRHPVVIPRALSGRLFRMSCLTQGGARHESPLRRDYPACVRANLDPSRRERFVFAVVQFRASLRSEAPGLQTFPFISQLELRARAREAAEVAFTIDRADAQLCSQPSLTG